MFFRKKKVSFQLKEVEILKPPIQPQQPYVQPQPQPQPYVQQPQQQSTQQRSTQQQPQPQSTQQPPQQLTIQQSQRQLTQPPVYYVKCPYCITGFKSDSEPNENGIYNLKCPWCKKDSVFIRCPGFKKNCDFIKPLHRSFCGLCSENRHKEKLETAAQESTMVNVFGGQSDKLFCIFANDECVGKFPNPFSNTVDNDQLIRFTIGLIHNQSKEIVRLRDQLTFMQSNIDSLQLKFDKLLDMIEFAPGGTEYLEAAQRFDQNTNNL